MPRTRSKRRSPSSRFWVIPPGLLMMHEPFEGFQVLEELGNEAGLLLWQALRDVELWSGANPKERGALFAEGALEQRRRWLEAHPGDGAVRRIAESLLVVIERPLKVSSSQVADLCEEASTWASDNGLPRTALAFAQRCALAAPEAAGAAYLVGLLARRNADYKRADTWFRRCLALARRDRDWKHYGLAQIGIANIHILRGETATARIRLTRALRAARRHGLWGVRAPAFHDLFCIAARNGEVQEAEMYARAAYRSYGRRHPRLPSLAHDVARFWMEQRQYGTALAVFDAVMGQVYRASERLLLRSSVAHAAAGVGNVARFEQEWAEVWAAIEANGDREWAAEALVSLARGAALLGQAAKVERAASYALGIALRRGEEQARAAAVALLETVWQSRIAERGARAETSPARSAARNRLARDLVGALEEF